MYLFELEMLKAGQTYISVPFSKKDRIIGAQYPYTKIKGFLKVLIPMLLLVPCLIHSQTSLPSDTVEVAPKALSPNELGIYSQRTIQLESSVRELMEQEEELEDIKVALTESDSLVTRQLQVLQDTLTSFSLDQLDKIESDEDLFDDRIQAWQNKSAEWRKATEGYRKEIIFYEEIWDLTADSLKTESSKIAVADTITRNTFERIESQIKKSISRLATLEDDFARWDNNLSLTESRLAITQSQLNEVYELIESKKQTFVNNIWIPEYPPIWKLKREDIFQDYEKNISDRIDALSSRIKRFNRNNTALYYRLLTGLIILMLVTFYLKRKGRQLFRDHPEVAVDYNLLLRHPLIGAIVIFIYGVLILVELPEQITYLLFILFILPMTYVLWKLKGDKRLGYGISFVVFALIFVYLSIFSEAVKQMRITLIVVNVICIYFLILVRKDEEVISRENPYWLGTLPALIPVFMFICGLAILADIIGSVQLSLVLTRAVIGTFLAYIVIKESVLLLESFIYLLAVGPLFRVSNIVKEDSEKLLNGINRYLRIGGYLFWIYFTLGLLKIRKELFERVMDFVNTPLEVGELSISLGDVLSFYIIIQISIWISRLIRYFLDKEVYPRTHLDKGVSSTISLMIRYTIAFLGFILALSAAGVNLNQVVVGISALGIGIGFGLQNIVNNFVSGIILALERPITLGDVVRVDGVEGVVQDIGLRASQIRTWDGADVLVPNGSLISGKLLNWTFTDRARRLNMEVLLPMDSDILEAVAIAQKAVNSVDVLSKKNPPAVNYEGNKDGLSVIRVYGWIDDINQFFSSGTAFRAAVYKALREEGYDISLPVLSIQMQEGEDQ